MAVVVVADDHPGVRKAVCAVTGASQEVWRMAL